MPVSRACLLAGALAAISPVARAQYSQARLVMSAGTATDVTGLSSNAITLGTLVSSSPSANLGLGFSGSGTRFSDAAWATRFAGAFVGKHPMGPSGIVLDARGDYTATSYQLSFITVDLTPTAELRAGPATFFGGAHVSSARTGFVQESLERLGHDSALSRAAPASVSRSGAALLYGTLVRFIDKADALTFGYREERGVVASVRQTDRLGHATLTRGRVSLAARLGRRNEPDRSQTFGSASLSLALGSVVAIEATGGRYPANRLTGTAGGRFADLGVSFRVEHRAPLPAPSGITAPAAGMTRLSITAPDAQRVEVAGDFTQWIGTPAQKTPGGIWYVDLRIPPGQYRYAFRINGKEWRVPEGVASVDDGFGGRSGLVTVRATGTGRPQ